MNDTLYQKQTRWQRSGTKPLPSAQPRLAFSPLIGCVVMAAVVIGLLIGRTEHRQSPVPSTPAVQAAIAQATPTPVPTIVSITATPSCTIGTTYLKTIGLFEARSQWEQAASTAEIALHDPTLCPADAKALAAKSVTDGLEALFTQPLPAYIDIAAQQHQVDRYHSLKHQAETVSLPFPTRLQIATRAYGVGQFLLAKVAFEEAWRAGEFTAADQGLLQTYYASLYNLGLHFAEEGSGKTREAGVALLVAADKVDNIYRLGSRTAWGALHRLAGTEATWPAPAATPLLAGV